MLCRPDSDWPLVTVNATGKAVWDLLIEGYTEDEIASVFAQHFGLSLARARKDVSAVVRSLKDAGFCTPVSEKLRPASSTGCAPAGRGDTPSAGSSEVVQCGVFRFGQSTIRLRSSVADIDGHYFSRFRHRAAKDEMGADVLELSGGPSGYRLKFRGETVGDVGTLTELVGQTNELLLRLEHPKTNFLAYFHAGAVSRAGKTLLLPGHSGVGKSTLSAYLVRHGFTYLGDDLIALGEADWSVRPLPTCLSLKSGAWPILTALYPEIPDLPIVRCHGRDVRYVELRPAREAGDAPSIVLFPRFAKNGDRSFRRLAALETMTRLIETGTDLPRPATRTTLAELLRFVEVTPAYEFVYPDLLSAQMMIEEWLDRSS